MLQIQTFTFNPFYENTYLLFNEKGNTLVIDPGYYTSEERRFFWLFVREKHLNITDILLTHAHLDHIFGLEDLAAQTQIIPKMSAEEQVILDRAADMARRYEVSLADYAGDITYLTHPQTYFFEQTPVQVLFTPGHSPGSLSYYFPEEKMALSGDTLFNNAIGRTDLFMGDADTLLKSIQTQLLSLPEDTAVYPGHGATTTILKEKRGLSTL